MPEQHILELEQQLLTADATLAKLTLSNAELTTQLTDAETRNRKLRRAARNDESSFKDQLGIAQARRG